MLKEFFCFLVLLVLPAQAFSQIPDGYYDAADGLAGDKLKSSLYEIIRGHKEFPYSSSSTDTWDILKETDRDTENTDNVILFYTGWSVNADQEYNNGAGWNREHVWAKSHGDFGTSPGPGTDAHHLRPSDISVNQARDSRWFDNCATPYWDNGMETGCFTSVSEYTWQPRAAVKGDVARIMFYMAARYEGDNGEPDLVLIDYLPADNYTNDPVHAKLSTLLAWHKEDPVDAFEQNRNDVIFSYQGNRNPFIDHPEYVERIWGDSTTLRSPAIKDIVITAHPNPVRDLLEIEAGESGMGFLEISSISGQKILSTPMDGSIIRVDMSPFPEGIYLITLRTKQQIDVKKILKLDY